MRKAYLSALALAGLAVAGVTSVSAQKAIGDLPNDYFFAPDQFDYTVGTVLATGNLVSNDDGATPWLRRGTNQDNAIQVVAANLTYPGSGLPAASGNAIRLVSDSTLGGQQVRMLFNLDGETAIAPADGNTYYYSLVFQLEGPVTPGTAGDYFAHLSNAQASTTTLFRSLLFIRSLGDSTVLAGVRHGFVPAGVEYSLKAIPVGVPVFAVVKLTEIAGETNDQVDLFLFVNEAVPATEPATADATHVNGGTGANGDIAASAGFGQFGLRQPTNTSAADFPVPSILVDDIRVGRS